MSDGNIESYIRLRIRWFSNTNSMVSGNNKNEKSVRFNLLMREGFNNIWCTNIYFWSVPSDKSIIHRETVIKFRELKFISFLCVRNTFRYICLVL